MDSTKVLSQIDSLIDELLNEGGLHACSLASMLMAIRDSVQDGYHVALARWIWDANNNLRSHDPTAAGSSLRRSGTD
jgi:hypothetical protein